MYLAGKHHPRVSRCLSRGNSALLAAALSVGSAATLLLTGCGNQYRPVVSSINPVGPAGQPNKFAVAVSNPNGVEPQNTITGYTLAGNVLTVNIITPNAANQFIVGEDVILSGFPTSTFLNAQTVTLLSVTPTQFTASFTHAAAAAAEGGTATVLGSQPGLVTAVDFSGDTVITTPQILTNPNYFIIGAGGTEGYVINPEGSLNFFGLANPSSLITSQVSQTTLPIQAGPVSLSSIAPANGTSTIFIPEVTTSKIASLNAGSGSLYQETAVPANPVYVVGSGGAQRVYAISQGASPTTTNGVISALEAASGTSLSISATLPVGLQPIYGVMTPDALRAFILNQGSGTVSVVNVVNNALDLTTPTITLPNISASGTSVVPHPVWADLSAISTEVVVLNQGDSAPVSGQNYAGAYSATTTYTQNQVVSYNGGYYLDTHIGATVNQLPTNTAFFTQLHPGSLSIISIPLCSASTPVVGPNCNAANPTDSTGFGSIIASPNVGIAPSMVSVLSGGFMAYVINQFDSTGACTIGQGSVSVVNLTTGLVTATICGAPSGSSSDGLIHGHPNSISATSGNPTGKVYVTSSDSTDLSIIYTDTNTVQTHLTLQGVGLRVLVTQP